MLLRVNTGLIRFLLAETNVEHVIETPLLAINDIQSLETNAKYENVQIKNNFIFLRAKSGEGSLLHFNKEISTDEWSFEFQVKNFLLHDVEKAGVYVWYTDKDIKAGTYKGGDPIFNGFVTGIEFSKERADIVFSHNFNSNFEGKELYTMRFDHINPLLIDNLEQLIVKIIHTEMNFKVEIYDLDKMLISDSFRIIEPLVMHKGLTKKHFSLTTKYEHCNDDVLFELSHLKIDNRKEHEKYDHTHVATEHNQYPRNKSDQELRLAIADISHFMNYIVLVLGSKAKNNIIEMTMEAKKRLRSLKGTIENIIVESTNESNTGIVAFEGGIKNKIADLEDSLARIITRIESMKSNMKNTKQTNRFNLKTTILIGSFVGLMAMIALEAKAAWKTLSLKGKIGKNE